MLQAESFCMFAATMKRKLHIGIWTLNIIIPSHKLTVLYILFFSSSIHALTRTFYPFCTWINGKKIVSFWLHLKDNLDSYFHKFYAIQSHWINIGRIFNFVMSLLIADEILIVYQKKWTVVIDLLNLQCEPRSCIKGGDFFDMQM